MASLDYVLEGYWVDGYAVSYQGAIVPSWYNIPVTEILPSYLYQQYCPDENVSAFFTAYNNQAQSYLDYLISLNLPVWSSLSLTGELLDWVALGLYGFKRPSLTYGSVSLNGGIYNSTIYDVLPYDQGAISGGSTTVFATDDIFQRCLTWNMYKGDGFQFNVFWLKKRVIRFLSGVNGLSPNIDNTYNVSVTYKSNNNILITVNPYYAPSIVQILQAAIISGAVQLPSQYNFSVAY